MRLLRLWAQDHSHLPRIDKLRFVRTPPKRGEWLNVASRKHKVTKPILSQFQFVPGAWPPNVADAERFITNPTLAEIDAQILKLKKDYPPLPQMLAVENHAKMRDEPIHRSGDVYDVEKEAVPRAVPTFARDLLRSPTIPGNTSGRLQLAQWITDPKNPLTARVIANRLWQGHFGTGIVATPGDFGVQGTPPTNQPWPQPH